MSQVSAKVRRYVKDVVGLQLTIARRAASMRNFAFGPIRPYKNGTVGEFALHIQCAWRIEGPDGVFTASGDLYVPANGQWSREWTYEDNSSVQDARLSELLQGYDPQTESWTNATDQLFVERVKLGRFGDAVFYLSGGYRLVIFPTDTEEESWRLFRPGHRGGDLVVEKYRYEL